MGGCRFRKRQRPYCNPGSNLNPLRAQPRGTSPCRSTRPLEGGGDASPVRSRLGPGPTLVLLSLRHAHRTSAPADGCAVGTMASLFVPLPLTCPSFQECSPEVAL